MRRHRPIHYTLAFLTVALGIAAGSGIAGASADPGVPADDTAPKPADETPVPPASEEHSAPEPPPTTPADTEAPAVPEPPSTAPDETEEPTAPETTTPDPAPITEDETPSTESPATTPTTPAEEQPDAAPTHGTNARTGTDEQDDELDGDSFQALPDGVERTISFPVLGPVQYGNDWGNCRDGCSRRHLGTDLIGVRMQPLLAAVDGTVTRVRYENVGTAGTVITITGADGWRYNYFHVNNDTPGTDDGAAEHHWQISPQVTLGSPVRAGQVIAYMGDSGNAEGSVPHLHFEIRQPDGTPVNPYHSLVAAQERQTCALEADAATLSAYAVSIIAIDGVGRWLIDVDGNLVAEGSAARGIECGAVEQPAVEQPVVVVEPIAAPVAPADMPWTVERGQSLWGISQTAYGISDVPATVSAVNTVFDHNRDQLTDPNVLNVGMTLRLPPLAR